MPPDQVDSAAALLQAAETIRENAARLRKVAVTLSLPSDRKVVLDYAEEEERRAAAIELGARAPAEP